MRGTLSKKIAKLLLQLDNFLWNLKCDFKRTFSSYLISQPKTYHYYYLPAELRGARGQVAPHILAGPGQTNFLRNAAFLSLPPPPSNFRIFHRPLNVCAYVIDPNLKHCVNKTGLLAILRDINAKQSLFMFFMHRQLTLIWTITSLTIIL